MNKLKFYIINDIAQSYFKSTGGVVTVNHMQPLIYAPDGHLESSIGWERDLSLTHGIIRNFTIPYSFVKDAYDILKFIVLTQHTEVPVFLLVQKFFTDVTDTEFGGVYKDVYKGLINLNKFKDEQFTKITATIGESGIRKSFSARKDTVFEYPLAGNTEAVFLRHDGMALHETHIFLVQSAGEAGFIGVAPFGRHLIGTAVTTSEGKAAGFVPTQQVMYKPHNEPVDLAESTDYLFIITEDSNDIRIKGTFHIKAELAGNYSLRFETNKGRTEYIATQAATPGGGTGNVVTSIPFDYTFQGVKGEKFFLFGVWSGSNSIAILESRFTIYYQGRGKPSYIPCFTPATVAGLLTGSITGSRYDIAPSALLEANNGKLLTSGDGLRGLPTAKFKTSLTAFFRSMHVIIGACLGIEHDKIVIEGYEHFYNFTGTTVSLGEVSKFSNDYAEELTGNLIKIGYREQTFDDVNGKSDFHGTANYSTPSSEEKTIELISDYDASAFAIEFARINYAGRSTTDSAHDNKIYIVDAKPQDITFTANIYADNIGGTNFIADMYADNFGDQHIIFVSGNDAAAAAISIGTPLTLYNTVQNNATYTVTDVAPVSGGVNVYVREPLVVEISTGVTFFSAGQNIIFVSGNYGEAEAFMAGLKFTITGSDLNNKTFTVTAVSPAGGGVNLHVLEPLTTELKDNVTFSVNNLFVPKRDAVVLAGVPSPASVFNVELSPANLMRVHAKYINSVMTGFEGMPLEYRTTDKNRELKYVASDGVTIDEDANVVIGTDKLFKNYFFGFDTLVPVSLYETLENTPDAHFTFTANGVPLKGLLHKAGISLSTNKEQQYSLLCAPDIDLKTLL